MDNKANFEDLCQPKHGIFYMEKAAARMGAAAFSGNNMGQQIICQLFFLFPIDLLEGLIQIGNDVIDVLDADGQTDGIGTDALLKEFFRAVF